MLFFFHGAADCSVSIQPQRLCQDRDYVIVQATCCHWKIVENLRVHRGYSRMRTLLVQRPLLSNDILYIPDSGIFNDLGFSVYNP